MVPLSSLVWAPVVLIETNWLPIASEGDLITVAVSTHSSLCQRRRQIGVVAQITGDS